MNYKEQLPYLHERVLQKKSIEAKLRELKSQQSVLEKNVRDYKEIMWKEQIDVERLEKISLTNIFYSIVGKKEGMLYKEKMDAYAAEVKYDSAVQELDLIKEDIRRMEAQVREISEYEQQYEKLLKQKEAEIKESGADIAENILRLEELIVAQKNHKKEIGEAISAGSRALSYIESVISSLDSAEGWGTWDLFGGGLISDIAKHSHLDDAQNKVQNLQSELRRFKTELADVTINADIQVNVDGFLRFADYFFDGLFADWTVLDKIGQSKSSVQNTRYQIEMVLSKLRNMEASADQTIKKLEAERESVILKSISI